MSSAEIFTQHAKRYDHAQNVLTISIPHMQVLAFSAKNWQRVNVLTWSDGSRDFSGFPVIVKHNHVDS